MARIEDTHYLLDTHAAIWFFSDNNRLSQNAKSAILDTANRKFTADDAKPPNGGVKSIPIGKRPEGAYENIAKYKVSHIW